MDNDILIISKEQVESLIGKLADALRRDACIAEVRRMLDIKSTLAWRADAGS